MTYLYTEITSIDIIAKKQVSRLRWVTTNLEEFHKVKVLSMYIAADCNGRIHFKKIWLALENLRTGMYDP